MFSIKESDKIVVIKLKKIDMLQLLFVVTMGIAFVHQLDGYIIPNYIKYGISLIWIVVWLCKMKIKKKDFSVVSPFIIPYIWIGLISIAFWAIYSHYMIGGEYIINLFYHIIYSILRAVLVLAVLELFKEKTFMLTFEALVFSELIVLMCVGASYGFSNLLKYCASGVFTSVIDGFKWGTPLWHIGWAMEVHDSTFAFGAFLLYFLICEENKRYRIIGSIISCLFVYLGLKRIEILALICVAIIAIIKKKSSMTFKTISKITTIIFILFSYVFIIIMKFMPTVFKVLDEHRVALYEFLSRQINIENIFIGKGFSIINDYLLNYNKDTTLLTTSHSDLVRMAIELGLLIFTIWIVYYIYIIPQKLINITGNQKVGYVAFLCLLYIFATYFIDNTLELFAIQIVTMMIPIGLYKKEEKYNK